MAIKLRKAEIFKLAVFAIGTSATAPLAMAQATGGSVTASTPVSGPAATFDTTVPGQLVVDQNTQRVFIDWSTFNIAPGESITFLQDASNWIALNRVLTNPDSSPGQAFINGLLQSQNPNTGGPGGAVWVIAPGGVAIGATGRVNTNGFLASTSDFGTADFVDGDLVFNSAVAAPGTTVSLAAGGRIESAGGAIVLSAPQVSLAGDIVQAGSGAATDDVAIAGARQVTLQLVEASTGELDMFEYSVLGIGPSSVAIDQTGGSISAGRVMMLTQVASGSSNPADSLINLAGSVEATGARIDGGDLILCGSCSIITPDGIAGVVGEGRIDTSAGTLTSAGGVRISAPDVILGDIDAATRLYVPVFSGADVSFNGAVTADTVWVEGGLIDPANLSDVTVNGSIDAQTVLFYSIGDFTLPAPGSINAQFVSFSQTPSTTGTFYIGGTPGETVQGFAPAVRQVDNDELSRITAQFLTVVSTFIPVVDPVSGQTTYLAAPQDVVFLDTDLSSIASITAGGIMGGVYVIGDITNPGDLTFLANVPSLGSAQNIDPATLRIGISGDIGSPGARAGAVVLEAPTDIDVSGSVFANTIFSRLLDPSGGVIGGGGLFNALTRIASDSDGPFLFDIAANAPNIDFSGRFDEGADVTINSVITAGAVDFYSGDIDITPTGRLDSGSVTIRHNPGVTGVFYIGGTDGQTLPNAGSAYGQLDNAELSRINTTLLTFSWAVTTGVDPITGGPLFLPTRSDLVFLDADFSTVSNTLQVWNIGGSVTIAGNLTGLPPGFFDVRSGLPASFGTPINLDAAVFGIFVPGNIGSAASRAGTVTLDTNGQLTIDGSIFATDMTLQQSDADEGDLTLSAGSVLNATGNAGLNADGDIRLAGRVEMASTSPDPATAAFTATAGGDISVPGTIDSAGIVDLSAVQNILISGQIGTETRPAALIDLFAGGNIIIGSALFQDAFFTAGSTFDPYALSPLLGVTQGQLFLSANSLAFGVGQSGVIFQQNTGTDTDGAGLLYGGGSFAISGAPVTAVDLHGSSPGTPPVTGDDFTVRVRDALQASQLLGALSGPTFRVNSCVLSDPASCLNAVPDEPQVEPPAETVQADAIVASEEEPAVQLIDGIFYPAEESDDEDEEDSSNRISNSFASEKRWPTVPVPDR